MKERIQTIVGLLSLAVFPTASFAQGAPADLSRMVVIGDSLSAGFQNNSLMASQQAHGYTALL
jgi:phospholipase/lecithinase/hemolysin